MIYFWGMNVREVYDIISQRGLSVFVNGGHVYKGIKFTEEGIYCTDSSFYKDITDFFLTFDDVDTAISEHLKSKYLDKIDAIEDAIKDEVNGNNNHNRYNWLKNEREHYLIKYNEQAKRGIQEQF